MPDANRVGSPLEEASRPPQNAASNINNGGQDEVSMPQTKTEDESGLNGSKDGYQVLQTASSAGDVSEMGWTVCDEEPPKPVGWTPDQEANADVPPGGIKKPEESQKTAPSSRNLVMEDYQMQLELILVQNKRRLEEAREEQERLHVGKPSLKTQTPMNGPPPSLSLAAMGTMQANPSMAVSNRMSTMTPSSRPPNQPDPMVLQLSARMKILQDENQRLRQQLLDARNADWAIFHCIAGEDGEKVYLDKPRFVKCGEKFALEADSPVQYPEAYGLYKSLHFVVYKKYSAHSSAGTRKPLLQVIGTEMPDPEPESEVIKLISQDMLTAMEKLTGRDDLIQEKLLYNTSDKELRVPHLWWYFSRNCPDMLAGLTPLEKPAMQSLRNWLIGAYGRTHSRVDDQLNRGMISASSMSYLIQPGDVLVCKVQDGYEAHLATSWLQAVAAGSSIRSPDEAPPLAYDKKPTRRWEVEGWSYSYNGDLYRLRRRFDLQLGAGISHDAEISIAELNMFPLRFASRKVRETLERRGKAFWICRNRKYVAYGKNPKDKNCVPEERYMIDCRTYKNTHPASESAHTEDGLREAKVEAAFLEQVNPPSEPHVYLFPRRAMGYDIQRKRWVLVDLDFVQEVSWNKNAFAQLVAAPDTKVLLQALITSHISSQEETGAIHSKGKGLTMLLRGPPGTGKTFSVESVAELIERPLYSVSCSDISTTPEDAEKYLEHVFYLAKTWGCIVVLDEADLFLERRVASHVDRNALIAAFIRAVEGYGGILILESNRLKCLDKAFQSRIQITLTYDPLTESQRVGVWRHLLYNLNLFHEGAVDFNNVYTHIDVLAKREVNGHEMRNILSTARQLAQFQKRKMVASHLDSLVKLH